LKKIISITLTTIAILIFISSIAIMMIGTRAIQKNEPLFIFNYSFSIIPSDSMVGDNEDSLDVWDIAIIKRVDFEDVTYNDVIVFQSEINGQQALIIHRIVGDHYEGGFETQGDNNASVDLNPVTEDNFKAVYVSKITFLKPIAELAANQKNLIFGILSLVLVGMVISELIHIIKTTKSAQEDKLKKEQEEKLKAELYQQILEEEKKKQNTNE
jgi:signal peptidase I